MSSSGTMSVASNCPIFDGTDYPYWKNKMRMHLEAIDKDLWDIVEQGIPEANLMTTPDTVKKNWQLDAKARSIIGGHLNKAQFNRISGLNTAKKIWTRLSKVNEGVSAQRDSRIDTLRSLFNRFKRLDNEHVQQTFDRLTDISNELQALGAADITDHEVVKKLLRSLDDSFEFLSLMIQERPDFKTLDPADILERLNAHELKLSEKRDLYSSTPKVHALKARARRVSSDDESEADTDDPETLSRELALLTRKFQRFTKKNRFGGSSRSSSSRKSKDDDSVEARKRVCHKCKKPGHYIAECPLWEKEARLKKKKKDKDDSSDEKIKKKSSRSSKSTGYRNSNSRKARAYLGKELDSEESGSNPDAEEEESEESEGVAGLALATTLISKSIFSTEESGPSHADDEAEDTTPAFCFMAKSSKVSSYSSSDDSSDEEPNENYAKLAKLASKQQRALEKTQISLNKSDDMLVEEMTKTQKLTDESKILQSKFDDLFNRHETLLTDHEKLSHEFLMRKQEIERVRMSHDDLRKENESLLSQQIIMPQEGLNPPCLKCIERDQIISVSSSSMSSDSVISITSVVPNPSSEDSIDIAEENARLKSLLETGMFKSLKGHQTLCDILKKQILNRNPRKEGIAFTQRLNPDGSYWKPEQYPETIWVRAMMPPPDPYTLSGYDVVSSDVMTESFDSNYKLFKNGNGEVFARYIGTNCRNGPPVKQIWVPKDLITNLPVNADANELRISSEDNTSKGNDYNHVSANHFVHREAPHKNAYSFVYPDDTISHPIRSHHPHPSSCASRQPIKMWVVKN